MPESKAVKVGLLAQAPTGNGGDRIYEHLSIEPVTVKNIRFGERFETICQMSRLPQPANLGMCGCSLYIYKFMISRG